MHNIYIFVCVYFLITAISKDLLTTERQLTMSTHSDFSFQESNTYTYNVDLNMFGNFRFQE